MISFVEGKVKIQGEDFIVLQTSGGVGYTIYTTAKVVAKSSLSSNLSLFTETVVKEDSITLFGFQSYKELIWFKSFIKISGIGVKTALLILNSFSINDIILALETGEKQIFLSVSGVGDKIATRLVNEMKKEPKKNAEAFISVKIDGTEKEEQPLENSITSKNLSIVKEASFAVESLGFNRNAGYSTAMNIFNKNPQIELTELIKLTLKALKDI